MTSFARFSMSYFSCVYTLYKYMTRGIVDVHVFTGVLCSGDADAAYEKLCTDFNQGAFYMYPVALI